MSDGRCAVGTGVAVVVVAVVGLVCWWCWWCWGRGGPGGPGGRPGGRLGGRYGRRGGRGQNNYKTMENTLGTLRQMTPAHGLQKKQFSSVADLRHMEMPAKPKRTFLK
mgnify:CR=1 FL=1